MKKILIVAALAATSFTATALDTPDYLDNVALCMATQGPSHESFYHFEDIVDYNVMASPNEQRDDVQARMVNGMSDMLYKINDLRFDRMNALLDLALLEGNKSPAYQQAFGNYTDYYSAVHIYCIDADFNEQPPVYGVSYGSE